MKTERLAATVDALGSGACIALVGDLDGGADRALADAYAGAIRLGSGELVLDFHGTGYINSTGIALVVRLLAEARRDRRAVRAVGLNGHYRELFRITRLADFMTIEDPAAEPDH